MTLQWLHKPRTKLATTMQIQAQTKIPYWEILNRLSGKLRTNGNLPIPFVLGSSFDERRQIVKNWVKGSFFIDAKRATLRYASVVIIALLSACASTPEPEPMTSTPLPSAVNYALSLRGAPYRYGKASPSEGFDCSGFVWHVYKKQGVSLPRTAKDMALTLPSVAKKAMTSGDLVFFNINGKAFSHVGIYIESGRFIHAPSKRTGHVLVSDLKNQYWRQRFIGVRRPR